MCVHMDWIKEMNIHTFILRLHLMPFSTLYQLIYKLIIIVSLFIFISIVSQHEILFCHHHGKCTRKKKLIFLFYEAIQNIKPFLEG